MSQLGKFKIGLFVLHNFVFGTISGFYVFPAFYWSKTISNSYFYIGVHSLIDAILKIVSVFFSYKLFTRLSFRLERSFNFENLWKTHKIEWSLLNLLAAGFCSVWMIQSFSFVLYQLFSQVRQEISFLSISFNYSFLSSFLFVFLSSFSSESSSRLVREKQLHSIALFLFFSIIYSSELVSLVSVLAQTQSKYAYLNLSLLTCFNSFKLALSLSLLIYLVFFFQREKKANIIEIFKFCKKRKPYSLQKEISQIHRDQENARMEQEIGLLSPSEEITLQQYEGSELTFFPETTENEVNKYLYNDEQDDRFVVLESDLREKKILIPKLMEQEPHFVAYEFVEDVWRIRKNCFITAFFYLFAWLAFPVLVNLSDSNDFESFVNSQLTFFTPPHLNIFFFPFLSSLFQLFGSYFFNSTFLTLFNFICLSSIPLIIFELALRFFYSLDSRLQNFLEVCSLIFLLFNSLFSFYISGRLREIMLKKQLQNIHLSW